MCITNVYITGKHFNAVVLSFVFRTLTYSEILNDRRKLNVSTSYSVSVKQACQTHGPLLICL